MARERSAKGRGKRGEKREEDEETKGTHMDPHEARQLVQPTVSTGSARGCEEEGRSVQGRGGDEEQGKRD